jgi:hypothetical protein
MCGCKRELHGNAPYSSHQTVHTILDGLELHDTTRTTFNVLEQGAQCSELHPTTITKLRAMVDWLVMNRAGKMLVQGWQSSELIVAKVAFETVAVPSLSSRLESLADPSDHPIRVRNQVVSIVPCGEMVKALASDARAAATGFEM